MSVSIPTRINLMLLFFILENASISLSCAFTCGCQFATFKKIFSSSFIFSSFLFNFLISGFGLNLSKSIPLFIVTSFSGKKLFFSKNFFTSSDTTTILSAFEYFKILDNRDGTLPDLLTATIFGFGLKNKDYLHNP